MVKTITKIGNSQGIIFDSTLLDLTRLRVGDQVDVTVHEGGAITLVPLRPVITPEAAAKNARELIQSNSELFRLLS